MPPPRSSPSNTITLPVKGYRQMDDYSCGALAGWSVVQLLKPQGDFRRFHKACAPSKRWGISTAKLSAAMRRHGITISLRKDLDFDVIKASIERGCPVLVSVSTITEAFWHWVVIYGVGWNPRRIYISASLPDQPRKEVVVWRTFEKHWRPHGFGLICSPRPGSQAKVVSPLHKDQRPLRTGTARRKRAA